MAIIRKIVDYRILFEKRLRGFQSAMFDKNQSIFNSEHYNKENLEWALHILDSRLRTVNFENALIPMLDFINCKDNPKNPSKIQKIVLNAETNHSESKAMADFAKDSQVFDSYGYNNDILLTYQGFALEDGYFDCYSFSATFSERKDDNLISKRKDFFQKFFMFDRTHIDLLEDCISVRNPFPRRILFYFYVCMMDENDLDKVDPKRSNLEEDRLVMEYSKERLTALYELYPTKLEDDQKKYNEETNLQHKMAYRYKIQQKKYLLKIIEIYSNEINKLVKEDIL